MRQNHTTIPWGPVVPHETYEGYQAFCKRQRNRMLKEQRDGQTVIYKGILTKCQD